MRNEFKISNTIAKEDVTKLLVNKFPMKKVTFNFRILLMTRTALINNYLRVRQNTLRANEKLLSEAGVLFYEQTFRRRRRPYNVDVVCPRCL